MYVCIYILPPNIEGVHGNVNTGTMWKYHYENIFNSVEDSCCDKVHFDCVTYNSGKTIDAGELMNIINELSCNKSPGLYGLTAEHIKFADSQLVVLLSILIILYFYNYSYYSCVVYSGAWLYTKINQSLLLYRLSKIRIDV